MKQTEESLFAALEAANLSKLPAEEDKKHIWLKAIAKITKSDGRSYYALVEKDGNLENRITRDFGSVSSILQIEAFYPYVYMDSSYLPKFRKSDGDSTEAKVSWLEMKGVKGDLSNLTPQQLDKEIKKVAAKLQLDNARKEQEIVTPKEKEKEEDEQEFDFD